MTAVEQLSSGWTNLQIDNTTATVESPATRVSRMERQADKGQVIMNDTASSTL